MRAKGLRLGFEGFSIGFNVAAFISLPATAGPLVHSMVAVAALAGFVVFIVELITIPGTPAN